METLLTTLRDVDAEAARQGRASVRSSAHLSAVSFDASAFLKNHLHANESTPDLIPDAFAYKARLNRGEAAPCCPGRLEGIAVWRVAHALTFEVCCEGSRSE